MSFRNTIPNANPFPVLGTFAMVGDRRDRERAIPWIVRHSIRRLTEEVESYRREFIPAWNDKGRTVLVRGPHGSGKTHTIYAALRTLATPLEGEAEGPMLTLYTLLQDDNSFDCYRQVVAHLNKEPGLWKKLAQSLLATMTAEQWSRDQGHAVPDQEVISSLQSDPEKLARTFESYRVSRSGAVSRQEKALLDLTPSAFNKDLKAAVDALQGEKFDQVAARWLSLDSITAEEQEAIGVSGPINSPEEALATLLLLIALMTNAGYKLVLVIDQIEKLFVGTEPLIKKRNEGYLRSMIEGVMARNALLILSGSGDGWNILAEDIRSRVWNENVIECPILTFDEALDLLRLYLTPATGEFHPGRGGIHPFTLPAVKEMLTLSAGNPRKLLQFSHEAMRQTIASKTVIDDIVIRQIAVSNAGQYFDRTSIIAEARRVLTFQPFRTVEDFLLDGASFDFAVLYADDSVALLIQVSDAIFQDDEAHNAYMIASLISRARKSGMRAPLVLIVTGYVSPEVVVKLSAIVQKLIIYAPGSFDSEIRPILDSIERTAAATKSQANREFENRIEGMLQRLAEDRSHQSTVIQNRAAELMDLQASDQQRLEAARKDWGSLRRDLGDKIRAARQSRVDDAMRHLNHQIAVARNVWIARDLVLLIFAGFVWVQRQGVHRIGESIPNRWLWIGALIFTALDSIAAFLHPGAWTNLQSSVDLDTFQQNIITATYGQIHALNPLYRLVRHRTWFGQVSISRERLGIIRQVACKHLGRDKPLLPEFWTIPESLILVERKHFISGKPFGDIARAVDFLSSLLFEIEGDSFLRKLAFQVGSRQGPWFALMDSGLDNTQGDSIPPVTERSIREAVRSLSPFEKSGIGTYDYLDCIDTIDELFLFCSQVLFYFERGVIRIPTSETQSPASNNPPHPDHTL